MNLLATVEAFLSAMAAFLLDQALAATVIFLLVVILSRFVRHSAVVHLLWLVVFVKLLLPPLIEFPVSPEMSSIADQGYAFLSTLTTDSAAPVLPPPTSLPKVAPVDLPRNFDASPLLAEDRGSVAGMPMIAPSGVRFSLMGWTGLLFLCGSIGLAVLGVGRAVRFRRQLRTASIPSARVIERMRVHAKRLDLDRVPRLRIVEARLSPMLWARWHGADLLLPSALLKRLGDAELDAVLVHELAHFKRRDHRVRFLEALTIALFWWYPFLGFMRRGLHRAEERACDVWVQQMLPGSGRAYARALLKTLEFLKPEPAGVPALACAIEPKHNWKERLTMIVTERTHKPLHSWQRWLLATFAIVLMSVFPTMAEPAGGDPSEEKIEQVQQEFEQQQREFERQRQELQRQRLALEEQMVELQKKEIAIEVERDQTQSRLQVAVLEAEAARVEARGHQAEAERIRREIEQVREESALTQKHLEIEREHQASLKAAEIELQRAHLQLNEFHHRGETEAAEQLEEEIEMRQQEIEKHARQSMMEQAVLERAQLERETTRLETYIEELVEQGLEAEVERATQELEHLREAETFLRAREAEIAGREVSRPERRQP